MRFIIHGAGAIGSLVGAKLAEQGAEVTLIARPAHAEAVNRSGLLLKTQEGERRIKNISAVTAPAELPPRAQNVVLLTVKSNQTAEAVHDLRAVLDEETPIVCLQNGVRNEETAAGRFLHIYGAMAGVSATLLAPGEVAHTLGRHIALGNYPLSCDEFGAALAARFEQAGFQTTMHESVMAVKWSKLILNLNNATYGAIDSYVQLATVTPAISRFLADVEEEGLHVLETAGIPLEEANNPFNLRDLIANRRSLTADAAKIQEAEKLPFELRTYPSTWVDLKQKRGETEAGFFNGEIILLGERHHLPTPFNSTLLQVVETMADEGAEPGRYTVEELAALVEQRRQLFYHS